MSLAGCASGSSDSRTIQVDFNSDDFAGSFLGYFPSNVTARPGMTLDFQQTWTGAPHSVTFGSALDANVTPEVNQQFFATLPRFGSAGVINQDAAQPCFVKTLAELPLDHKACASRAQVQPEFTGEYAYYSSGVILPEGPSANRFTMKIADDAKPGTYFYYCNVHGLAQSGRITISKTAKVLMQKELNRQARDAATELSAPLLQEYRKERAGSANFKGNLAGSGDPSIRGIPAEINEFTPREIRTRVNRPVSWTFVGNHSISFNVPAFTPLFKTLKNGDIVANDALDKPAGGWPGAPAGHPPYPAVTTDTVHLDAGTFDGGGGLRSSGIGFNTGDTYAVAFAKRGTYPYACLIHPGMIGKVVVT